VAAVGTAGGLTLERPAEAPATQAGGDHNRTCYLCGEPAVGECIACERHVCEEHQARLPGPDGEPYRLCAGKGGCL
jgi:hypothetical protein